MVGVRKTPSHIRDLAKRAGVKGNGRPNVINEPDHYDVAWMNKVRTKVNKRRGRAQASGSFTIFKVQENIRDCNEDAYTPLLISIGPYHHRSLDRDSNFRAMKNHKWLCLRRLLFRHRSRRSATELLDKCLLAMKSLDSDIRSCYSEPLHPWLGAQKLAMVMLLDGCFILHRLLKQQNLIDHVCNDQDNDDDDQVIGDGEILLEPGQEDEEEPLQRTLWIWDLVLYDLLKLENQIPLSTLLSSSSVIYIHPIPKHPPFFYLRPSKFITCFTFFIPLLSLPKIIF